MPNEFPQPNNHHRHHTTTNPSPKNSPFKFNSSSYDIQKKGTVQKMKSFQNVSSLSPTFRGGNVKKHVKVSLSNVISQGKRSSMGEASRDYGTEDNFHLDEDELLRTVLASTRRDQKKGSKSSIRKGVSSSRVTNARTGSPQQQQRRNGNTNRNAGYSSTQTTHQPLENEIRKPHSPGALSENSVEEDSVHDGQYAPLDDDESETPSYGHASPIISSSAKNVLSPQHQHKKQHASAEDNEEIVYPTLQQPILLDETTYMTRLGYSSNQWHLSVISPNFDHIEYQIHVTLAHHTRITMHHPIQPRALFELVKGALLEGAASFDYFWISGVEYTMTLGNVDEMIVSQNGWKGDARAETDRLLLWVGLGRDLGYWLILEPVRVEVSAKQVLRKLRALEEEHARVLTHNKSLLIKNEVLQRQEETTKADTDKLHKEIHNLKKENGKLKQMLVNMIQHMVQKQQRMMRALGNLEALHGEPTNNVNPSSSENVPQEKNEATFSWNPLKKHRNLSLSNYCRTVVCKVNPGKWVSCLGDEIWTEGVHQWDIVLRGKENPQFQSVMIGVADPSHSLSKFCGSTELSYGLFIHSGNLYHKEIPKPYIKTARTASERESLGGDNGDQAEVPFIQFKPNDTITVVLNLNDGTLKYVVNGTHALRVACANLKGPLCACVSFCDATTIEVK